MGFFTKFIENRLKSMASNIEPRISKEVIKIFVHDNEMIDSIIANFIEKIKNRFIKDNAEKTKLLAIVKNNIEHAGNKSYDDLYNELINDEINKLEIENDNLKKELKKNNLNVKNKNVDTFINDYNTLKGENNKLLNENINLKKELKELISLKSTTSTDNYSNFIIGMADTIIEALEPKIIEQICIKLNSNSDKIIESAIRVFVQQLNNDINIDNIEINEIIEELYKTIEKKLDSIKLDEINRKIVDTTVKKGGNRVTHKKYKNKNKMNRRFKSTKN
jgi:hypothetical protein